MTESDGRVLPGSRATVTLVNGDSFTVRITNRELLAWDLTRSRHKWPAWGDAPFLALTFTAYKAATREKLTALTWDQWQESVDDLSEEAHDEDADLTHPSPKGPEVGSS